MSNAQKHSGAGSGSIVVITAGGPYPWVIINALTARFPDLVVLQEQPESKTAFLRRRARKLGWFIALGQFITMALSRSGKRLSRRREAEIIATHDLRPVPDPAVPVIEVSSANADDTLAVIAAKAPSAVLLAGCRMLSRATLDAMPCPVINYHAGINPAYRGMMGGYWARATSDTAHYGTTVHLVDAGVDTGDILYQAHLMPDPKETMFTDAMAQAAGSRAIVLKALEDAVIGTLKPQTSNLASVQRYHPPIWTYLRLGLLRGVW